MPPMRPADRASAPTLSAALPASRRWRSLALWATAAWALAACGGGGGGDANPAPAPPPPAPAPAAPTVSSTAVDTPRFSQRLRVTLNGSNLDAGLTLSSSGCTGFARSTTAPDISTPTTAYYTCTVNAVGDHTVSVARSSDNQVLASLPYIVPVPQVSMEIGNGAGTSGTLVITLTPAQTPITVTNFLAYVNAGFYDGTAFHRHAPNFVLQGGGFAAPLLASAPAPAPKATNPPIDLEVGRGLSNTALTLAMARTNVLNSATSQFFINLGNNAFLDTSAGGYAVFGSITAGADFVATMRAAPCAAWPQGPIPGTDCLPVPNFVITSARQTR